MRGRLLRPILVSIARFDAVATAGDPDGAGPLESGFDEDYKEIVSIPVGTARKEFPTVLIPAQYEDVTYDQLQMAQAGDNPAARTLFTFHFSDLEEMDLVGDDGNALIRVGDRAVAVYRYPSGDLIMHLGTETLGLYCVEAKPASFGLLGGDRNLLICAFERRATAG